MYFREINKRYISRWWLSLLRSILSLSVGILWLLLPATTTVATMWAAATVLIIDALIIAVPLVLGRVTTHVWKVVLAREIIQIALGLILFLDVEKGFELILLGIGLLFLFRAILEIILFVELPASAKQRGWLLLTSVVFFVLAIRVLFEVSSYSIMTIRFIGLFFVFEGISHLLAAFRNRRAYVQVETYEHAILSDNHTASSYLETPVVRPRPAVDRSFLLLHIRPDKYRKILVFSPHPDDLEAFVGGLAFRLTGEVVSVIFSGGDKGRWADRFEHMDDNMYIRVRLEESEEAARLLGVREINYLGYLDRAVPENEEAVRKVLHMLRVHKPDLVISFEYMKRATPYPHPDHLATANVVRRAIARYEKALHTDYFVTATLLPNRFIDVTGIRRIKLDALACHTTQTELNKLIFPFLEKLFSRLWGTFSGVDYAEGYRKVDIPVMIKRIEPTHD